MKNLLKVIAITLISTLSSSSLLVHADPVPEKNMTIVIPSYNNALWYKKNVDSALSQNYTNFNIIYVDDCSPDNTGNLVEEYLKQHDTNNRVKLIKNSTRHGAMANIYNAIHSCDDTTIILTLDGDDWFAHGNVLKIVNSYYQDPDVWMTYGNYLTYPNNQLGHYCQKIPDNIIKNNAYRDYPWVTSHLRTCYTWLFKAIKKEDLYYNNDFTQVAPDLAYMYPMLEMAGGRFKFIPDILYTYNTTNPISEYRAHHDSVIAISKHIIQKPRYTSLKPILVS